MFTIEIQEADGNLRVEGKFTDPVTESEGMISKVMNDFLPVIIKTAFNVDMVHSADKPYNPNQQHLKLVEEKDDKKDD